ncbi:16910_t:CDS:2, partial [Racocetra persica]
MATFGKEETLMKPVIEPVKGLIAAQEEEYQPISNLFDYYYENRNCSNIKYNIGEVKDNQKEQLFELLKNNLNSCVQDISEL